MVFSIQDPIAISADSLGLSFGTDRVISPLSFEISVSEFVSIVGPSGCGKTSLLRMVADLEQPSEGTLSVGSGVDRSVGYVFQDPTLLPWRSVLANVVLPLELAGRTGPDVQRDARRAVDLVGLRPDDHHKYPHMLSGGMRMRVSLARAIVARPQIMLFDEPFAALDDMLRQRLNAEILKLWANDRWTGLFVTHNVSEAVYLSRRVIVLSDRPSRIRRIVDVPFSYPREDEIRTTTAFNQIVREIQDLLHS